MAVTLAPTYLPHIQCFTTGVSGVVKIGRAHV